MYRTCIEIISPCFKKYPFAKFVGILIQLHIVKLKTHHHTACTHTYIVLNNMLKLLKWAVRIFYMLS